MKKYQKVRFETFTFGGAVGGSTYTLKLNEPAEVTFECFGIFPAVATINNTVFLYPYDTATGSARYPYNKIYKTNLNEIDITQYTLAVSNPNIFVKVTCKYYVNE